MSLKWILRDSFFLLKDNYSPPSSFLSGVHINSRTIRGEVLLQPAGFGRTLLDGLARWLRQRERARRVHGAPDPHHPGRPERGDGEDLLQPGDQGAVGQVPWAGHRDDHHQVREVKHTLGLFPGHKKKLLLLLLLRCVSVILFLFLR